MSLTPEQVTELQLAESWAIFQRSAAGKDFQRYIGELVDGALVAIRECSDYRESTELVIRYQQRKAVMDKLSSYIASQVQLRDELLELWKEDEPDGNTSS